MVNWNREKTKHSFNSFEGGHVDLKPNKQKQQTL